ncbi:MAG: hypothetical protein Kow0040_28990 [Thermogutta sp.]
MPRVLVLTPAPTPYRDPFWGRVAQQPGIDLLVCYLAKDSRDRPWRVTWPREFSYRELSGYNFFAWRGPTEVCYWNPEVARLVRPAQCDAVILGGYNHPTLLAAMWQARRHDIPFFVMSESHLKNRRSAWKAALKRPLLRWMTRHATGLFPTGELAQRYFEHYGARPDQCVPIPNVPDVVALRRRTLEHLGRRQEVRERLGIKEGKVILFVGRLIPKKGVRTLIEACARLTPDFDWRLILLGDGTARPQLEDTARRTGAAERVRFAGFVQPQELPDWYLAADAFVLPSSETWGVVALEALACGLPVIVSDQTGCGPDILPHGEHADRVFPFGDAAALAERLAAVLRTPLDRRARMTTLREHLERFEYDVLARRMAAAVTRSCKPVPARETEIPCPV